MNSLGQTNKHSRNSLQLEGLLFGNMRRGFSVRFVFVLLLLIKKSELCTRIYRRMLLVIATYATLELGEANFEEEASFTAGNIK